MIVCHCEAVNDRAVRAAVLSGARTVAELTDRCSAGASCGGCHPVLEALLDRAVDRTARPTPAVA